MTLRLKANARKCLECSLDLRASKRTGLVNSLNIISVAVTVSHFAIGTKLELDSSFPNSGLPISLLRFTYLINVHAYLST